MAPCSSPPMPCLYLLSSSNTFSSAIDSTLFRLARVLIFQQPYVVVLQLQKNLKKSRLSVFKCIYWLKISFYWIFMVISSVLWAQLDCYTITMNLWPYLMTTRLISRSSFFVYFFWPIFKILIKSWHFDRNPSKFIFL